MSDGVKQPIPPEHLFVGRVKKLEHLCDVLDRVISSEGRMLMLVGEPGIGKTRTAAEFAKLAKG